jgi:hypothetical protein
MFSPLYTVLLLVPSELFIRVSEQQEFKLYDFIRHDTGIEAELFRITRGLAGVVNYWSALGDYFDILLVEDFMEPTKYSKLLFDDENFTRSRKCFWAIGCLSEFDVSITDDIKQWDLYYEGRIKPVLDKPNLTELFGQARRHRDVLQNLRTQFRNKRENVKTLRDGVSLVDFPTLA